MRFGYWLPVFGGWLRNVPDRGFHFTLIAEQVMPLVRERRSVAA